jgi:glucose-1-phosphate thymidylyltransferase
VTAGRARPLVGVVPAAGKASRLPELPCSKEIFPLRPPSVDAALPATPCESLLHAMAAGGAARAYVVVGRGKWDIPAYLGGGSRVGLPVAYVTAFDSQSSAASVDAVHPFLAGADVVLGFPDIVFEPRSAFLDLVARLERTAADVVLGLFPAHRPDKVDMVDVDASGRVRGIVVKPERTALDLAWIVAVWTPVFTTYLHERLPTVAPPGRELYVGDAVQSALDDGLHVDSVTFGDGVYRDIGTPDELAEAVAAAASGEGA